MDQYTHGKRFGLRGWHIGLFLVICFVGPAVTFAGEGKNDLEKEIAAIRAAGYPTNFEELEKYYSIPKGVPNAADVYTKAFDAYQKPTGELADHLPERGSKVITDLRGPLDPNRIEAIISDMKANKETLELLGKAAAIKHCKYDLDFRDGTTMVTLDLGDVKGCVQLLAEQTMLLAHQGDADAAIKNIARQLALGESFKKDPDFVSQLMRMAVIAMNCSSVEYILNRTTLTDEQLAGLQQRLSHVCQDDRMAPGLIGERLSIICLIDHPEQDLSDIPGISRELLQTPGFIDKNLAMSLKLYAQYIDAMKLPGHQRLLRCREIEAEVDELSNFYPLTKMLAPSVTHIVQRDLRVDAQVDCARVALGIERYRLAKGALPKVLDDLVPQYIDKVPIDPFDGKPVRYKLTEPGYIVYSIGADGSDEGGLEKRKRKDRSAPHDWPFIVEH